MARLPTLPRLLDRKIYKTGQTRGADDDQIFQNRVGRNSTVLIPLGVWRAHQTVRQLQYENGYIVLVPPPDYFDGGGPAALLQEGVEIGRNALIFYELRSHWNQWNPDVHGLSVPTSRTNPLGGQYVARVANTTAAGDERINRGYTTTGLKGAGIRLYEYAPTDIIQSARCQLEALFWLADDSIQTCVEVGMSKADVTRRRDAVLTAAAEKGFLDYQALQDARTIDADHKLVCPLCLERISSLGFMSRMEQAAGRERHDLTVTEINLFHIKELAYGLFNHRPYNLGWGHHHCNVVCKDSGIIETLKWMNDVLGRNQHLLGK
jgi:hypothetical protein